jgi:acetyl esterase/lipase
MPTDADEIIRLWPDGPPTTIADVPAEASFVASDGVAQGSTVLRNISDASLTVMRPAAGTANGVGVIVVPGGGWSINMWTHEGVDVARWLNGLGCTAFVLKYRVQATPADPAAFAAVSAAAAGVHTTPLPQSKKPRAIADLLSTRSYLRAREAGADDGRRAIEVVRNEAERFGVRPESVGMIGFSAGAYLIVDVAMDPRAPQVAFLGAIYGGETQGRPVPDDAPPLFQAVAHDDVLVKICEGLHADWSAADRPSELHLFSRGQHGFGLVKQGMPSDRWPAVFEAWLEDVPSLA